LTFTDSGTVLFLSSSGSTQVATAGNARQRHVICAWEASLLEGI